MKMYKFSEAKPYMVAHVIREETEEDVYREYGYGSKLAKGFDVHLCCLKPELKNEETLSRIFKAAPLPTLCLNYGVGMDFKGIGLPRETLMDQLIMSVSCGASAVDVQGYSYEPLEKDAITKVDSKFEFTKALPHEVTINEKAIQKQIDFIDTIHKMGGEVLISTHTGVYMHTNEVVSLAKWIELRHPDIIKIVNVGCDTDEQVLETLETVRVLKNELKCKFTFHCNGIKGHVTRLLDPIFGSYMAFSVRDYKKQYDINQLHLPEVSNLINSDIWMKAFETSDNKSSDGSK